MMNEVFNTIKKVFKIDEEDIYNILTDILDEYPELVFECVLNARLKTAPEFGFVIYFYKKNWSTNGGHLDSKEFPLMLEMLQEAEGKLNDLGLSTKSIFNTRIYPRFFYIEVCN